MYPHRIRLRGPWECEPVQRRGDDAELPLPPPCRMAMPSRWSEGGLPGFSGRVRFRRRFHYPGRIDDYERVWLTFAGIDGEAEVRLNDQVLGHISAASEFEITSLLLPRNELVIEIENSAEQGGLWSEVALEVRCTAYVRDLRCLALLKGDSVDLRVCGQVVGMADRPLELYLLLDRSVVAYQVVTATAEGQPFEMVVPSLPAGNLPVQVDLVNGAVVWYTISSLLVPPHGGGEDAMSDRGK